jgi:hypothetical protein
MTHQIIAMPTLPPRRMPITGNANGYRTIAIALLAIAVLAPVSLIVYQSFLSAAFFSPKATFSFAAFTYVFTDKNFYKALGTTTIFSFGMVAIAVPLGGLLAFLITRTDIKFKKFLEVLVLVPMFIWLYSFSWSNRLPFACRQRGDRLRSVESVQPCGNDRHCRAQSRPARLSLCFFFNEEPSLRSRGGSTHKWGFNLAGI